MAQLRQNYNIFQEIDTVIVAIGSESREIFAKYWKENDISYIGIPDHKHKIADLYGQEVSLFKMGRMPAQMIWYFAVCALR